MGQTFHTKHASRVGLSLVISGITAIAVIEAVAYYQFRSLTSV